MKKIIFRILLVVVVVWFLIFAVDMISFFIGSRPVFMVQMHGGEMSQYTGLGYWIEEFFPWTTIDDPYQYSYKINVIPYVVINVVLIATLVIGKIRQRKV